MSRLRSNYPSPVSSILVVLINSCFCSSILSQDNLPKLFINEFQASNAATVIDPEFQEYSDWLEIYNGEDTTVVISGFYLTDNPEDPQKYKIPLNTKVRPGWRISFWADGRNTARHTNFKLSRSGEHIGLYSAAGALIDSLSYGEQIKDMSYGRYPDGGSDWFLFDHPTPVGSNVLPGFKGRASEPHFAINGGFYDGPQIVVLTAQNSAEIVKYTLDGSPPDEQSLTYSEPLRLSQTTVVRAQAIRRNYLSSSVITHTFLIDEPTTLPVVCVATDPANLWSNETGIYVEGTNGIRGFCSNEPRNWNQPWEKPISLEMFEVDGAPGFKLDAGMQIGGGCTRLYPQKTLAIYARSSYGTSKIEYQVFDDKAIGSFNNILLRNSGQDWWRAMFRDGFMQMLVKNRMDIDWQAYKPAVLFLNGEYWGLHAIREKHNEHYLESNFGIDPDKIDILKGNAVVKQGSARLYNEMIEFIETHDMALTEYYDWVSTQMDIDEYLNYQIAEIYFANIDWPGGNTKTWRQHGENHKWRWILFDTDLGFGAHSRGQYDSNTLANATATSATYYANPPWSTFLLRKLLQNSEFKNQFIQRFASHLNTTFKPERVHHIVDSLKANIAAEIPRHIQKWAKSTSFDGGWSYHVEKMHEFASRRPGHVINHVVRKFGLSGTAQLHVRVQNSEMGKVLINGVAVPSDFAGIYFRNIPIQCKAQPKHGYRFVEWQGIAQASNDSVAFILTVDDTLDAVFETDETTGLRNDEIPSSSQLHQNYPNPFNAETTISYVLQEHSHVKLSIFDITGRVSKILVNQYQSAGAHSVRFDASGLSSGVYFYDIEIGSFEQSRKMLLLR